MSGFLGMFTYGGPPPPPTPSQYIAYSGLSPGARSVGVFPWDSTTGFGTIYSNPSAIISSVVTQISFVKDNSLISASFAVSPYISAWPWSAAGYGTKYADPSSLLSPTGTVQGFTWTNAIDAIITFNQAATSFPQAWAWSSGFGTKYANGSAITASGATYGVSLNGDNSLVAFNFSAAPYVALYPWSSSSGFGTRYANPSTSYTGNAIRQTISFNKVTNDLALGSGTNPYVAAYAVSSSGFGSKYANPPFDGFTKNSVNFNQDGTYLATSTTSGTPIFVYPWSSGFGTRIFSPGSSTSVTISWSSTGTEIAKNGSPINAWPWNAGFGTQYANPSVSTNIPSCVSFSNQSR